MCKVLKVSRAGYYKYLAHTPSKREIENKALKECIQDIHSQFRQCYGYRRVKCELDARGIIVNHKRVYRLMKECNLSGKHHRKNMETIRKLKKS
ncbi:IS3 family transposase [Romboutsia lituseburensis]|uniref:IS3 family transposase n=1 Tax=Romboutsia lituseburensis TaxID=1537 RepID=UPI003B512F57